MTSSRRTTTTHNTDEAEKSPRSGIDTHLLLWGWPELLEQLPMPRRTIEKAISAGSFPKPLLHVGRRPFWRPDAIRRWAEGV